MERAEAMDAADRARGIRHFILVQVLYLEEGR